ncbi:MAG: penicillin acylase family protein [Deltaproteobacteria bacterium]|nr:penicillin acylase family protein [Deltaproteobacteria bacterium]
MLFLLFVVIGVLLVGFWNWVKSSGLPSRGGEATIASLESPVKVQWDSWAVPHIRADSLADAMTALGYLHANDRMTQMELGRRKAAGRIAEILGLQALDVDRSSRALRYRETAEELWGHASPEMQGLLQAYAKGVNAWLEERGSDLPPGLKLMRVQPEPWEPVDSLGFILLMAEDLSFWQGQPEDARFEWLSTFGAEASLDLLQDTQAHIPGEILTMAKKQGPRKAKLISETMGAKGPWKKPQPAAMKLAGSTGNTTDDFLRDRAFLGRENSYAVPGSNGWVLGGSWTASGKPIVANDPHLGLRLPGTWFQVLIRAPGYEISGVTLPGVPAVVIGRTAHLAWSFTNTMLDDHDLFYEQLDETGTKVKRGDSWLPIQVKEHKISVKGSGSVTYEARSTDRGPLLGERPEWGLPHRSLAWTAYEPGDPLGALLKLARATTLEEAFDATEGYIAPAQNLMVADRDGGLMYVTLGRVPQRRQGDGRFPSPGWDLAYGWDGVRPLATNPQILRPESDLLVTANNDFVPEDYPLPFTADFDGPYREQRIRQILEARRGWTAAEQVEVQTDIVSLHAKRVIAALTGSYDGDAAKAYEVLAGWDGTMSLSGPPALFDLFMVELANRVFRDEMQNFKLLALEGRGRLLALLEKNLDPRWFDNVDTEEIEGRQDILSAALSAAWQRASKRWGDDIADWSYGDVHHLNLLNPLGRFPLIGGFFNRGPFPMPGSGTTAAASGGPWLGERRALTLGQSMLWVVDFADPDNGLMVIPGGQSGHPKDPHYDDQLALFVKGEVRQSPWSEAAVDRASVAVLQLNP